jgi:hypothetical protein
MIYSVDEPEAIGNTRNYWTMRIVATTGEFIETEATNELVGILHGSYDCNSRRKAACVLQWAEHPYLIRG